MYVYSFISKEIRCKSIAYSVLTGIIQHAPKKKTNRIFNNTILCLIVRLQWKICIATGNFEKWNFTQETNNIIYYNTFLLAEIHLLRSEVSCLLRFFMLLRCLHRDNDIIEPVQLSIIKFEVFAVNKCKQIKLEKTMNKLSLEPTFLISFEF